MGRSGIRSSVRYGKIDYFSTGVAHRSKAGARRSQQQVKAKGGVARIRKYRFGYVVYGRRAKRR